MSETKRIEYIDLAKGICILMVMSLHIAPEIGGKFSFLICLRMPLYYCLSGIFFKEYGSFRNFCVKKIDKLLIPFIGWYLLGYLIYYLRVLAIGEPAEHTFRITDLFFETDFYNGSLWFLLSLFWCNLLYYQISVFTRNVLLQAAIVTGLATIGWIWSYMEIHNFLYIGTTLTCLPFFFIGRRLFTFGFINNDKNIRKDLAVFLLAAGIGAACMLVPAEPVSMLYWINYLASGNPVLFYITSISLIISALLICKYVGRLPYISYLGRYSIIVLVTHGLLNNILNRSIRHIFNLPLGDSEFQLILLISIIALMALVIPFCRRFFPYITAQKSLLETKLSQTSTEVQAKA